AIDENLGCDEECEKRADEECVPFYDHTKRSATNTDKPQYNPTNVELSRETGSLADSPVRAANSKLRGLGRLKRRYIGFSALASPLPVVVTDGRPFGVDMPEKWSQRTLKQGMVHHGQSINQFWDR
ncbi:MAG: hypothetical protein ABEJ58_00235, partial [Halodesulfurarchaeum sp.]